MARIAPIDIADNDLDDVLASVEETWKRDVESTYGEKVYAALSPSQKLRACLVVMLRVRTRNKRRERAEKAITVTDIAVS